ncbi:MULTISPECIES: SH3-like domain-containing protein [unclassified Streptomyces]|uniref:SH3-like domain-containing protein n=1 Tax=unclassified Streptomyces TaxID=2593676 RepID=UPI00343FA47B
MIDPAELADRTAFPRENSDAVLPKRADAELLALVAAAVTDGAPAARESNKAARCKVGDVVIATDSPGGHTHRTRYVRSHTSVVTRAHGTFIYPDKDGNGGDDAPEHLYAVCWPRGKVLGTATTDTRLPTQAEITVPVT